MNKKQWEKEFDKKYLTHTSKGGFADNHSEGCYPEIDAEPVKQFIAKQIDQAKQEERNKGKHWYFEGDDLIIMKGKWVVAKYKKLFNKDE
jgi:hypothetical protein